MAMVNVIKVVICLVSRGNVFYFQHRNFKPEKGGADSIGCFGGAIENSESPETTSCREVAEETSLTPKLRDIECIGNVQVIADKNLRQVGIDAKVYQLDLSTNINFKAKEGQLVKMNLGEIQQNLERLTPATKKAFKDYILKV